MKHKALIILLFLTCISYGQDIKSREKQYDNDRSLIYCIAADTNTYDNHFGVSYTLFLIKEAFSNDIVDRIYLPVNLSPDFPYSIIGDYLDQYDLLIIKGVMGCYIYYPDDFFMTELINPDRSKCDISDGHGGYIKYVKLLPGGKSVEMKVGDCHFTHVIDLNPYINKK